MIGAAIRLFRAAPWLDAGRALAWARLLALAEAVAAVTLVLSTRGGSAPSPWGQPLGTDFVSFWTAGGLALAGSPASAWNVSAHAAAQKIGFGPESGFESAYYAFFYPPPFLLICLPLALVPYGVALAAWVLATGTAYGATLRCLLPRHWPCVLAALAFPAVLINAGQGQNAALTTSLVAAASIHLDRRPRLAGACLGALCVKPQLAVLVVPALVAARRWRSLAWVAIAAFCLCAVSLLTFGVGAWTGFVANASLAKTTLEAGLVGFAKMTSLFAAARLLGADLGVAWALQIALSLATLAVVVAVARKKPGAAAEGAVIATGACLVTPFLLDYDLMLLAVPMAFVATQAARGEFLPWEKLLVATAFVLPLVARLLATRLDLPVAPLVVAGLLAVVVRRVGGVR